MLRMRSADAWLAGHARSRKRRSPLLMMILPSVYQIRVNGVRLFQLPSRMAAADIGLLSHLHYVFQNRCHPNYIIKKRHGGIARSIVLEISRTNEMHSVVSSVAPKSIYCEYFKIRSSVLILFNNYTMPPRITSRAFSALTIAQPSAGSSSTPPPAAFSLSQRKRSPSLHSSTPRHFSTLHVHPGNSPTEPRGWRVSRRLFCNLAISDGRCRDHFILPQFTALLQKTHMMSLA